ncbi:MAG: DUF2064 domain-containing protein [Candidatus Brocadia sp.]
MDNALIVFLKYPEPGKVKTRLAKDIGNEKAYRIYKSLAENVIKNIFPKNQRRYDVHIFFTPADKKNEIIAWIKLLIGNDLETGTHYIPQEGTNLGERMSNAFKQTLQGRRYKRTLTQNHHNQITPPSEGMDKGRVEKLAKTCPHINEENNISSCNTIIIGTDCPEIDAPLIEDAFELLKEKDVVIGPCNDGGYYLLGMSRFVHDLFADIPWSTDRVFDRTMEKIQKNNLSCSILKTLADIDTQEDLYRYAPNIFTFID